ncbi:hypothetical protein BGZ73_006473 [Actinomortierella ambigua]|nr:hypothetical protein BGZ73_006473 [Actinomortierella ambigua]
MMHRYTPRESLPICKKDDEKHPLRGAFIQRFSENIMGEDKPIEWVPYGCRLVNTVGVSGSSRIIETVLDDATPSFSDTNDLFNPGMEPSVVRSREEMNTVESKDDTIEERSILLIGDSQVRALMERLIQSSTSGLGQVTSKLRNEAQSNVMGPKRISYTSKTVVLDVQRKLDGGRIRVRIQHQFDPFLYHLGNLSASARAGKMFPAHNLHANPNQQHTMYTAGTAGPEVPSFLPSFQDHMFDTVLFNFGHWPASGKHLGGHWTSDDVLTHLQDVIHSLKEYERLRSQEHERRRHEEQQRRNYFGRMYGAQPDAWPYLRHTKMEQHRTFQALFLGMPATHTRADTHLQEAEDWKNNYRFAYWSSLAEELMAAHSIPTLDSFGITLLAAGGATEDNISIDQEVTDAVVAAVTHFIDV